MKTVPKNLILPNMITLLGLLCGVYSMVAASHDRIVAASIAILLAAVFDGLDGKVARLVNGASDFGVQLDSLADVISFGVAPAFLIYSWQLSEFGRIGLMVTFLFVACGALRLARFNVQTKTVSNLFFVGMPIPGAAGVLVSSILFVQRLGLEDFTYLGAFYLALVFLMAFLMVSTVPYYSFKKLGFLKTHPFNTVVVFVLFLVVIGIEPAITIFTVLMAYVVSGFVMLPVSKRLSDKLNKQNEAKML